MKVILYKNVDYVFCKQCFETICYDKTDLIPFIEGNGIICPKCKKVIIIKR